MANQEHLDKLKQGVEVWNQWKREYFDENADKRAYFFDADLSGMNLEGVYLEEVSLRYANLSGAKLKGADLSVSSLVGADLSGADLSGATLEGTDFSIADLSGANLSGANLSMADLSRANLSQANLSGAELRGTILGDVDLSVAKGLETVNHDGPSTIGIDTIIKSQGKIPEIFLRGAGVPPSIIEAIPSLVDSLKPIDFYSCFISHSSRDQEFAEQLRTNLRNKGVRCWYAPENLKIGDRIRDRIDEAIHLYDKLLLILSEHSVNSEWVEDEVEAAMERERIEEHTILFPVRLDDAVKTTSKAWAAKLRRQRNIGDFTNWKDHDTYQKAVNRLLRDLKAEAQKMRSRDATTNGGEVYQ